MGWNKRSSGNKYDSISGHRFVLGGNSKKIMNYRCMSKCWRICAQAECTKVLVDHECPKIIMAPLNQWKLKLYTRWSKMHIIIVDIHVP